MNMNQPNILVIKKYKTKFSLPKYAAITITKVTQPWNIYIRIEDEDAPRYLQMLNELELKFRSVTRTSASYCSSLTIGSYFYCSFIFQISTLMLILFRSTVRNSLWNSMATLPHRIIKGSSVDSLLRRHWVARCYPAYYDVPCTA